MLVECENCPAVREENAECRWCGPRLPPFEPSRSDLETPGSTEVAPRSTDTLKGPQISDPVEHPSHYRWLPVEAIEITENFNFCMGNALKYILRADHKGRPIEDIRKSIWYLQRELANRERLGEST